MTLIERWQQSVMNNYGTPPIALVRGEGAVVWDESGRSYVDLLGGIAVHGLGHGHPAVVAAVTRQIGTLGHVSNLYVAEPPVACCVNSISAPLQVLVFAASAAATTTKYSSLHLETNRKEMSIVIPVPFGAHANCSPTHLP